jgi:hypothetical protein
MMDILEMAGFRMAVANVDKSVAPEGIPH